MHKRIALILSIITILSLLLTGCCLKHDWQEATCTAPRTCAKCGKTEGEPIEHTWTDATTTNPQACSVCGETVGDVLADACMANDEDTLPEAFQALISGDVAFIEDSRIANELNDIILPHGNLEYAVLDLDGDNSGELLIQMINEPSSYNAVFHYDGKKLVCWNHDMVEMSCRDYPLQDGTMVRQYDYGGMRNYTLFRYCTNGEREETAHLFVRDELIPVDSAEPCPYYEIDGESVDEQTFNAALEEKICAKMLERDAWKSF